MYEILIDHLSDKIVLSEQDKKSLERYFKFRTIKKKEVLLQEGSKCEDFAFVTKGLLRSVITDDNGAEHTNFFAAEGWWISDMCSYFTGEKSTITIEAIEDSELLLLGYGDFELMMRDIPAMERYFRILFQNSLMTKDQRLHISNTGTSEEKYLKFIEKYPKLYYRIPQNILASYLGFTPETLSRLKRKLL